MTALALLAGGALPTAAMLGVAMLGFQFSIGALNDLVDESLDARTKPAKPIPSGYLTRPIAWLIVVSAGTVGLVLSAAFGPVVLGLGMAMYACGLVYDWFLKTTPVAGACFAGAFALLPVYAWWAVTGELPPRPEVLLPIAALAGPTLQLANGIVDFEGDRAEGLRGPVVALGRRRTVAVLLILEVAIHGLALMTLRLGGAPVASIVAVLAANCIALIGVRLSASVSTATRERGWQAQAAAIVLLGVGWILGVTA